jgi:hypothetical protein
MIAADEEEAAEQEAAGDAEPNLDVGVADDAARP